MDEQKNAVKQNEDQSGIVEVVRDLDFLLDELTHERTEHGLEKRREKDDMDVREEALVAAGEELRAAATSRCKTCSEDTVGAVIERDETSSTPKKAGMEDCGMDKWQEMIRKELWDRRRREEKNISLRTEELKLQREKWEEYKAEREERKKQSST